MKLSRSLLFWLLATVIFSLSSCGSNEKPAEATTAGDSTAATTPEPAPVSTVITTPQSMMVTTHKVKDFDSWKASYEAHDSLRLANGIHSYVIGRGLWDPNMVLVAVKVDDMAKAKAFAKDPSLKKAMQKGGVVGNPTFHFVTTTFQDTAAIGTQIRSSSFFKVKDFDAWQKSFEEGKQLRTDNGIVVRAYGHDADDNHKVRLVTALTDTAKAFAFWKSDEIKKRRAASGVIGEPERFVYNVVKRY
jgi:hypothetical protein